MPCQGWQPAGMGYLAWLPACKAHHDDQSPVCDGPEGWLSDWYRGLVKLNLGWCERITDAGVQSIAGNCHALQHLDLCGCLKVCGPRPLPVSYGLLHARLRLSVGFGKHFIHLHGLLAD